MKYRESGVDIDKAGKALKSVGAELRSTWGERVLSGLGAFGGLFDIGNLANCAEPVLVSSIDGVGTKLKIAFAMDKHDTVGACLVNHCVNDILVQGARPLFFLDYFATGGLSPEALQGVLAGMARACRDNGCALIGGETAEMPGFYTADEYDLAGCIVGLIDKSEIVDGSGIRPGDLLIGFSSTGLHTNGYSLARKVLLEDAGLPLGEPAPGLTTSLGEALLAEHRSYLSHVECLRNKIEIKGMVHLTGGGFLDNIPRILPEDCHAVVETGSWTVPPLFKLIGTEGDIDSAEMHRVFNMGVGFVLVVAPDALARIEAAGPPDYLGVIGRIEADAGPVILSG